MNMLAAEIAEYIDGLGLGVFSTNNPSARTIFVGNFPQDPPEGIYIVQAVSPPPHEYVDTEYTVLDFYSISPHTDRGYALLQAVFDNLHRRGGYNTTNWNIYFSRALGSIVDIDRDREGSKLFRLSVQFICRNLNNVS